ncbi:uncharacterized protein EMH_0012880 [Eimeria mitis]|uniref:Uncharacterized protein n=1 Tax=Eimeria mitis TaxID=44415 RepID=U6K6U5_9EIME|nr:uncharacterized protein EMH_0012880 [Eimeria mitis]CDJ32551.1 hypothetical protein, conserved [Eimeria mitis]
MKHLSLTGRLLPRVAACVAVYLFCLYPSFLFSAADAVPAADSSKSNKDDEVTGDDAALPPFTGGLFEYRRIGAELVSLWREYTAMSDALSHLLRDYNVAVKQEQRVELVGMLQRKHKAAEAALQQQQQRRQRGRRGGAAAMLPLLYGELASLKELKKQMKRIDKKLEKIPEYRQAEENAMQIRFGSTPQQQQQQQEQQQQQQQQQQQLVFVCLAVDATAPTAAAAGGAAAAASLSSL